MSLFHLRCDQSGRFRANNIQRYRHKVCNNLMNLLSDNLNSSQTLNILRFDMNNYIFENLHFSAEKMGQNILTGVTLFSQMALHIHTVHIMIHTFFSLFKHACLLNRNILLNFGCIKFKSVLFVPNCFVARFFSQIGIASCRERVLRLMMC